ncbi:MAG TPA: hypothetical protein VGP72_30935 [Planctomycetota bacterium]|jgi:hypothetical protein
MTLPLVARKVALVVLVFSGFLLMGGYMSGAREFGATMGIIFAGALIALAIAEVNPRDQ